MNEKQRRAEFVYRQESASVIYWGGPGWYGAQTSSQGDRIYRKLGDDRYVMPQEAAKQVTSTAWYDAPPDWVSYVRQA